MRNDKLGRELELILLLTESKKYTSLELCERLGITRRNLYYYFEFFRDAGFKLIKSGRYYSLDRRSRFFKRLRESIDFTENEAIMLRKILDASGIDNPQIRSLKSKLDRFYDLKILSDVKLRSRSAHNINVLYDAIKQKKMVLLKNYSSPHSKTVSDRIVEPFCFMNDNMDIRCYELKSKQNKTFRTERMENVELIDVEWLHEKEHKKIYTDIFMFSGERKFKADLLLGHLAFNILKEEYPQAVPYTEQTDETHWRLRTEVCSFLGISRFAIGLLDDVKILGGEEFKQYMKEKVSSLADKLNL